LLTAADDISSPAPIFAFAPPFSLIFITPVTPVVIDSAGFLSHYFSPLTPPCDAAADFHCHYADRYFAAPP
jgi:hypothetical protein